MTEEIICLNYLGNFYGNVGDAKKSEEYLNKSLEKCSKLIDEAEGQLENIEKYSYLAETLNLIGDLNMSMGNFHKAHECFRNNGD